MGATDLGRILAKHVSSARAKVEGLMVPATKGAPGAPPKPGALLIRQLDKVLSPIADRADRSRLIAELVSDFGCPVDRRTVYQRLDKARRRASQRSGV